MTFMSSHTPVDRTIGAQGREIFVVDITLQHDDERDRDYEGGRSVDGVIIAVVSIVLAWRIPTADARMVYIPAQIAVRGDGKASSVRT